MKTIILAGILGLLTEYLQGQGYMWQKQLKGTGQANPTQAVQDKYGNYYVYGNFNGILKIDSLTFSAQGQDLFIVKYSPTGNMLWAKIIYGTGTEAAYGFKLSNTSDAIYFSGSFNSNPINILGTNISNTGGGDIFLAKMDLDGNLIWAKNIAYGTNNQSGGFFDLDNNDNIVMVGIFTSSVTFYNNSGTLTLPPEEPVQKQSFVAKFDSDGILQWSKMVYSNSDYTTIRNVSTYNNSNEYYLSGQIAGIIKYDENIIANVPSSNRHGFIFKINQNGNFQWSRKIYPKLNNIYVFRQVNDNNGNVYIAGYFNSIQITFDSTQTDTSRKLYLNAGTNTNDIFIAKYNNSGNFQWAKVYGGAQDENILNLSLTNDQILMTGSYTGKINFGSFSTDYRANSEAFNVLLSTNGEELNLLTGIGKNNETGTGGVINNRNFVWIGEFYSDTLFLNNNIYMVNDFPSRRDGFIIRHGCFDSIGVSITKVSCPGGSNGSITAIPSFGSEPYTYLWSNGQTTQTISNLPVGTYSVTVTGANGCSLSRTINLTQQPLLQASIINVQHNICFGGSAGSATANPIDGTPAYTYRWSNGKTTQTISNLPAGTYTVTIKDACNTTATASVTITEPAKVDAYITTTPVTCRGGSDGTATANPIGGLAPYQYNWSNGQTTQTATGLSAGVTYKVTVKDGCNNTVTKSTTVSQPNALSGSVVTYPSSPCVPTGKAIATASDGTPPYSYLWNTGATTSTIENLAPGTYTVTIRDACNASKSYSKSVGTKTISLSANITCTPTGSCQGSITVNVTGGDSPYTYRWSNGQTTQTATNLCKGIYTVTVKDAMGCTKAGSYSVPLCKTFITENNITEENSLKNDNINVYPNPASNKLYVSLPDEVLDKNYYISIYNLVGQKLTEMNVYGKTEIIIDIDKYPEGIYLIKISFDNETYTRNFIIKRQ